MNPGVLKCRPPQFEDEAARKAREAGYDAWAVFNADEQLIVQGCTRVDD